MPRARPPLLGAQNQVDFIFCLKTYETYANLEAARTVKIQLEVFWFVTPYSVVVGY